MAAERPPEAIEQAIKRYARRIEGLSIVRDLIAEDPQFAADLAAALQDSLNGKARGRAMATGTVRTAFDRVAEVFADGRPHTAPEIVKATGIDRGVVGHVLYKSHANRFEQKPHPRSRKLKLWRMKPESEVPNG